VFLPERAPAYVTREQFERNQAQLRANRPDHLGPVRAGTALLSGLLVCGHCGSGSFGSPATDSVNAAFHSYKTQPRRPTSGIAPSAIFEPLPQSATQQHWAWRANQAAVTIIKSRSSP
jgi:hypothetical protein